jgi:predicted small secreted protein
MKTSIRCLSALLLLGTFAFGLTACNTIHGVGQDTQKAGEKIQKEADEHKDGGGATESSIQRPAQ